MNTQSINRIASDFVEAYKSQLKSDGKVASGNLINTMSYKVDYDGRYFSLTLNLADYYKYVEEGRKPGKFPPIDKIREWIQVKPVLPHEMSNGKLPTQKQLAFLISRSIARKGIKGTGALKNTIKSFNLADKLVKEIYAEMNKEVEEVVKEVAK